jgi:type II secretory pathway predicted ATPase ExeA
LIIDEAQNLSNETLEAIRLLSNLETESEKLLQIILLGQSEIKTRLDSPSLRQLNQRISLNLSIDPFDLEETERYIKHRLEIGGCGNFVRFEHKAVKMIHEHSGGIPRKINKCCEMLLLSAQNKQIRLIDAALVREVFEARALKSAKNKSVFARIFGSEAPRP